MRVGLAVADAGLSMANGALGMAQRALGEANTASQVGIGSLAHVLGLEDAVERANRLAKLMDDDAPLGRALAPNGPIDRLLRPGGLVDQLTAEGGLLDRLTTENGAVSRALAPGGLVDQGDIRRRIDGPDDHRLRCAVAGHRPGRAGRSTAGQRRSGRAGAGEDGVADRLLAEGGVLDTLTARGRTAAEQLADVADTFNRLTPGLEALGRPSRRCTMPSSR